MHKIKELLMDELHEYEERAKKMSGGKISAGDLETIHKLTDTIKNIDKIEMLEGDDGYSNNSYNFYRRNNYDEDSSHRQNRDRMGRYSRDGGYSRDDGKNRMMKQLEEMMNESEGREKEMIRGFIDQMRNM
jgi:hypothetical protein